MDLVTQDSYEKRHRKSTIPTALVKGKKTGTNTKYTNTTKARNKTRKDKTKNTSYDKTRQTKMTAESADNRIRHHNTIAPRKKNVKKELDRLI